MERARQEATTQYLLLWLRALNRTLEAALTASQRSNSALQQHAGSVAELNAGHSRMLLRRMGALVAKGNLPPLPLALDDRERRQAAELATRYSDPLPFTLLENEGFEPFEICALVICAAPLVDPAYGRVYGFLLDDLKKNRASVGLLTMLAGEPGADIGRYRQLLSSGGRLRRLRLLHTADPLGDDPSAALVPAPGLVDWLCGARATPPVQLGDLRLLVPDDGDLGACEGRLATAALGMRNSPTMMACIWGGGRTEHETSALAIAGGAAVRLYRARDPAAGETLQMLAEDLAIAAAADAICWIDCDSLVEAPRDRRDAVTELLAAHPQRLLLSAGRAWRPVDLIATRPCLEIVQGDAAACGTGWTHDLKGIAEGAAELLASTFPFSRTQRRAALNIALADPAFASGDAADEAIAENLRQACGAISAPDGGGSAIVMRPRRTLDDLVLPPSTLAQVAEVARLYRHSARVDGDWGFGRISGSSGAIKALFTGDPGTGKTLAAEAIAAETGMHLLKVELSKIVSKWIGETEKNLEEVFRHAEKCRSVLFFDEAEALFGKRGEVRHGTDRYANMEVSYLLQRLETFGRGVVILSSNLRDDIDPAFTRRFQIGVNFPRPTEEERLRIWKLAFSKAPLDGSVRLDRLASLEQTGGSIVAAARMAALLAAADEADMIGEAHVSLAIERQFNKEARLLHHAGHANGLSVARGMR